MNQVEVSAGRLQPGQDRARGTVFTGQDDDRGRSGRRVTVGQRATGAEPGGEVESEQGFPLTGFAVAQRNENRGVMPQE